MHVFPGLKYAVLAFIIPTDATRLPWYRQMGHASGQLEAVSLKGLAPFFLPQLVPKDKN